MVGSIGNLGEITGIPGMGNAVQAATRAGTGGLSTEGPMTPGELSRIARQRIMAAASEQGMFTPVPLNRGVAPEASESFGSLLENLVREVDAKGKASAQAAQDVMLGRTDNLPRAMLTMQESGIAFELLMEVRNKLVTAYQELLRMQ